MNVRASSNAAYVAAGLACALPAFVEMSDGRLAGWSATAWIAAAAVFSLCFASSLRPDATSDHGRLRFYRIVAQTLAGLAMMLTGVELSRYTSAVTLVLIAQQLPGLFPRRNASLWVAGQSLVASVIFWSFDGWLTGLSAGVGLAGIQGFAFGGALLRQSEREARDALSRINAELRATRALLAENSRAAERLRISRDLHDTLGHHLAALSLQLDVAARRADGAAAEHIREAHAITRLLLSDVRDVVGQLRESGRVDVIEAVRPLVESSGEPWIHLDAPEAVHLESSACAHTVIRCIQEIITNATRHSCARNVWIQIAVRDGSLELHARDDGRGAAALVCGNGLTGMKERFEEHAGRVEFATAPGSGFEVHAFVPASAGAAP